MYKSDVALSTYVIGVVSYVSEADEVFSICPTLKERLCEVEERCTPAFVYNKCFEFKTKVNNTRRNYLSYYEAHASAREVGRDEFYIKNADAIVVKPVEIPFTDQLTVQPVSAVVNDYKPPTSGSDSGGEGVKHIRFIAQKNSYCEIGLDFTSRRVIGAKGLPSGLFVEKGLIKGSPTLAGLYPITLELDNETSLSGTFVVPELDRKL